MNFPNATQNFKVRCCTTLDPAAHFEQLSVRWLKQCQMVKNGLGFCVELLQSSFTIASAVNYFLLTL